MPPPEAALLIDTVVTAGDVVTFVAVKVLTRYSNPLDAALLNKVFAEVFAGARYVIRPYMDAMLTMFGAAMLGS